MMLAAKEFVRHAISSFSPKSWPKLSWVSCQPIHPSTLAISLWLCYEIVTVRLSCGLPVLDV